MFKLFNKPMKVLTPDGYKKFNGIAKYVKKTLIIETEKTKIEVAELHRFVVDNIEVFAKDLNLDDYLEGMDGYEKIITIEDGPVKEVYDLCNVEGEVYYTNQILSHNTFLGSSSTLIGGDALKAISPTSDDEIIRNTLFEGLRIFEEPKKDKQYIITVDPKVDGADMVGIHVVDVTNLPFVQVASANLEETYLLIPSRIFDLAEYYNRGMVVVENNMDMTIADALYYQYEYEGEVFVEKTKKKNNRLGFRTTKKTKKIMISMFKKFVEEGMITIRDKKTVEEMFNFIEKKNGTYSAEEGYHDDLVMSLMLVFAPFISIKDWDNFRGFIELIEQKQHDTEKEEQETSEFLDLGFGPEDMIEETPFTEGVWNNFDH